MSSPCSTASGTSGASEAAPEAALVHGGADLAPRRTRDAGTARRAGGRQSQADAAGRMSGRRCGAPAVVALHCFNNAVCDRRRVCKTERWDRVRRDHGSEWSRVAPPWRRCGERMLRFPCNVGDVRVDHND